MRYRNGEVPESALVIFKRGHNDRDGDFYWGLPPSTYLKHLALVGRAEKRTGRVLSPSDGWSTYRPLAAQIAARKRYGNGAARQGTSSHGGFWEGHDTAAVDYGNWAWVYAKFGNRARDEFYADCRAVGLTPGMISKVRGYPDEPWHVIDLDPWAAVPEGSIIDPVGSEGEDDMTPEQDKLLKDIAAMLYAGAPSAEKPSYLGAPGTIYRMLAQPVERVVDGVVKRIPQIQDNADTNTLVRVLLARQAGTDAAIKALSAANGVDPDLILRTVQDGVEQAMRKITFAVSDV